MGSVGRILPLVLLLGCRLHFGDYERGDGRGSSGDDGPTDGPTVDLPPNTLAVPLHPRGIAAGDFNEDGKPDLAIASETGQVTVLLNAGNRMFQAPITVSVAGASLYAIVALNADADGHLDLAVADNAGVQMVWLKGDGTGHFAIAQQRAVSGKPVAIVAADFSGDGVADLALACAPSHNVDVMINNGTGNFGAPASVSGGAGEPTSLVAGRVDAGGSIDIVAGVFDGSVWVLKNGGTGTFTAASFPGNMIVGGVGLADYDRDGFNDVALCDKTTNQSKIMIGSSTGALSAPVAHGAGTTPVAVIAADIDGDGHQDLAVANEASNTVSVMHGPGNGSLNLPVTHNVGKGPSAMAMADFDADLHNDIAVANYDDNTVTMVFGPLP